MQRTDLLIIGGGTAGLAAAATASEHGLAAVVVEKNDELGGQLHWSFGQFSAAGTRLQERLGISDSPQEHYDDVMRIGHGHPTSHLVRLAVEQAGAMVDWLEDLGFPFTPECPALVHGHEVYSKPRTYWGRGPRTEGGLAILQTLRPCVGPSIDVLLNHRFVDLMVDGDRVVGARVEHAGNPIEITAQCHITHDRGVRGEPNIAGRDAASLVDCAGRLSGPRHGRRA